MKDKVLYILTFIFVFILPYGFFYYTSANTREKFYERVNEDHRICIERSERDSEDTDWCDRIKSASVTNFDLTNNSHETFPWLLFFLPVLFVLIISIGSLRKQIEEIKEKIDV